MRPFLNRALAALAALTLLSTFVPATALAQAFVRVERADGETAIDATHPFYVTSVFTPTGVSTKITAGSGSSVSAAMSAAGPNVAIYNSSSTIPVWVAFGTGSATAAVGTSYYVPAGQTITIATGTATWAAAYGVGGTADVYFTPGTGQPQGWGGGGGGSGGATTIADGADVTEGAKADAACAGSGSTCTVNARLADMEAQLALIKNSVAGAGTTGGCTPYHAFSAASTNSTLVSTGVHTLCSLTLINTTATVYYVRVYDLASAPTCSSATGAAHSYPVPADTTGKGVAIPLGGFGEAYLLGLGYCITGGGADTDNTNAATGVTINGSYK